jgi:integrase/recombinase XerD
MNYTFLSNFKKYIEGLIEQKQAIGFPYVTSQKHLKTFDRFCLEHYPQETRLTREIGMHWAELGPQEHVNTLIRRTTPVRQLAKYMNSIGVEAYVIPQGILPKGIHYVPHIYTSQELKAFFASVDRYSRSKHVPARHLVAPVMFRILYCCGLRSSEARGLRIEDVDLEAGKLIIRKSKGNKDRNVMLSEDVSNLCRVYHEKVSSIFPDRVWFFPNHQGNLYSSEALISMFHQFWNKAGIGFVSGNPPRVHDFRHSYAVNLLNQWVRENKDLNAYLPYLSMYLGHATLTETDYYLHLVPEFFPLLTARATEKYAHLIPEVGQ